MDKLIDNLIFHEGNISLCHQEYISRQTPSLNIKFVEVSVDGKAFKKDKDGIPFEQSHGFGIGYRHMCSFWFVDFWKFVEDYDLLLRINEDCFVDFQVDGVFLELDSYLFVSGRTHDDMTFVTEGLNGFTLDFLMKHGGPSKASKDTPLRNYKDQFSFFRAKSHYEGTTHS